MRIYYFLFTFSILISCNDHSEKEDIQQTNSAYGIDLPSEFYPKKRAQVLVVGTFHFNYPGLDTHKTENNDKIDVLKEPRSREITELVDYIKKFQPNKVAIEANPDWDAVSKLREYRNGKHFDKRDERYQLAMRIATEIELDTLYSVDSHSLQRDLFKKDSIFLNSLFDKINWDIQDPYWDMATEWLDYRDKKMKDVSILEFFKYLNSREVQNANFGLYLTGSIAAGEGQGADHLSIWWYNRNLRIFSNIVNITEGPEDRILVIMGNGHAAILRQLFEASPQYQYVEFNEL